MEHFVEFEEVSKYYQTGSVKIAAADHLNFYVDKGEFCIIVGPSGAGKTTLLNILLYALFSELFGYKAANSWGNVLDNILCILFAYATNRAFVFASKTHGRDAWREFGAFVTCRLGTLVLDAVIMLVGGNLLAAQGAALVERLLVSLGSSFAGGAGVSIIGGADGPTAIFVSGAGFEDLWGLSVKVFSNLVVIVLNYVLSKWIVFKKK